MPFTLIPYQLGEKRGALLRGMGALSELAPLPGFSCETLEEALVALESGHSTPSSDFARDSWHWQRHHPIRSGVVSMAGFTCESDIDKALSLGFKTIKLKVTPSLCSRVLLWVKAIYPYAKVRLDANRSLSFQQALTLIHALPAQAIDYFEEPTQTFEELEKLAHLTPIPLALDETLREQCGALYSSLPNVSTWVLKPMLLGGLERLCQLRDRALSLGIRPHISSSMESAIGICNLAHIALTLGFPTEELGLDTSWCLADNFFDIPRGRILDLSRLSHQALFQ